jgi:uncharacterized protein YdhG (YjbR/CyaY superfamily)
MWQCPKCRRTFKTENQHHFCGKITTIDEYIADCPEQTRPLLQKVRETIRAAAPNAKEKIAWQMPTFWQGENLIHFAAFKNHIGLYPGAEAVELFAQSLAEYKTTKGAIQLPISKPIPYALITEITAWRVSCAEAAAAAK